jgi:hypothetical protein
MMQVHVFAPNQSVFRCEKFPPIYSRDGTLPIKAMYLSFPPNTDDLVGHVPLLPDLSFIVMDYLWLSRG